MTMRPGKHYPGTTLTITGSFDEGCDPVDPDISITFKLMSPCGVESSYVFGVNDEMQKAGVGRYTCDVTPSEPGRWVFQWVIKDDQAATIVDQGDFLVQATPFYSGTSRTY